MSIRSIERLVVGSLVVGLASLAVAILLLGLGADTPATSELSSTRATLTKAQVLRTEFYAADERFDTLIAGLVANVGFGTPQEIAPDLDHIQTARALELALGRRTEATEKSINQALGRANDTLVALSNPHPLLSISASATRLSATVVSLVAAALILAAGLSLGVRALALRRAEEVRIAERLAIPVSHAVEGSLAAEVTIFALTRQRAAVHETVTVVPGPSEPIPHHPPPPRTAASSQPQQHIVRPDLARHPSPSADTNNGAEGPFLFEIEPLSKGTEA